MEATEREVRFQELRLAEARASGYEDSTETWGGAWALLGVLVGGKILIVVALLAFAPSRGMLALMAAYNWSWIVLLAVVGSGPIAFGLRLLRVRRRRNALLLAEWKVD